MNPSLNALVIRAFKTFIQSFLAVVLAGFTTAVDLPTTKALLIGAFAAGVSATMNLFLTPREG